MKALTLHQPWASAIAAGLKRYETRSWSTSYRGPLAIHAGKSVPPYAREFLSALLKQEREVLPEPMPLGAVVAIADLVTCHRITTGGLLVSPYERSWGDWSDGRFAWELASVRVLTPPVPARGAQGLWEWSESGVRVLTPYERDLFDAAATRREEVR